MIVAWVFIFLNVKHHKTDPIKKVWDHLDLYLFYYGLHKIMNTKVLLSIYCLLASLYCSSSPRDSVRGDMSTATRKRNGGSASRSSSGSTSPLRFAMRRTTSLSDLTPPQEMVAGLAPVWTVMGEASARGAGMRRHTASADCFTVPETAFLKARA